MPGRWAKELLLDLELSNPLANHLLSSLPRDALEVIRPALKLISLKQGTELCRPGEEVEHVYFPHDGMVSLLVVMRDGIQIETATIGPEGAVGIMAGVGLHISRTRAIVQLPLIASQITAAAFRKGVQSNRALQSLVVQANDKLLAQVQITTACNALHLIEARLARWILQSADRTRGKTFLLTQELLSQMLGVTRSSVNDVAKKMQVEGLIKYTRGNIEITNRRGLAKAACECYETIRQIDHKS